MLLWIKINNYALIKEGMAEFSPRFNVITGETGAGKSILLGAVETLFGARADLNALPASDSRCEISGQLAVGGDFRDRTMKLCADYGIPFDAEEGTLNIKRVITRSGSRCFINDSLVTLATLKDVTGILAEVHTANSHQQLGIRSGNLETIDKWAGCGNVLTKCREAWEKWKSLKEEKEKTAASVPDKNEVSRLSAFIEDVENISPAPGEDEEVDSRHRLAADSQWIMESSGAVCNMINGEGGAADILGNIYRTLEQMAKIDAGGLSGMLEKSALISEELRELAAETENYAARVDLDEESFMALEKRRSELFSLRRRYGMTIDNILAAKEEAAIKCKLFYDAEKTLQEYDEKISAAFAVLKDVCSELSLLRRQAAPSFCIAVQKAMADLGLERGRVEMSFSDCEPGPGGADDCEILFAANPGLPLRSLRATASSGELSRMLLAIKSVMAERDAVPVMIFDEIDANLGGETAHRVGDTLCRLADNHQIIAISHLAQVSVRADRHFKVSKGYSGETTASVVDTLEDSGRVPELARMLGGGDSALHHAEKLLENRKG